MILLFTILLASASADYLDVSWTTGGILVTYSLPVSPATIGMYHPGDRSFILAFTVWGYNGTQSMQDATSPWYFGTYNFTVTSPTFTYFTIVTVINPAGVQILDIHDQPAPYSPYRFIFGEGIPSPNITLWFPDALNSNQAGAWVNLLYSFWTLGKVSSGQVVNVGWGGVVAQPFNCSNAGISGGQCPDLIIIGTTQVAARVEPGDLLPLTSYLQWEYFQGSGVVVTDDMIKFYFYDFNYNGEYYALPVSSDLRAIYFNKTLYDEMGLNYPPPWGNWSAPVSKSWSWLAMLDQVRQISAYRGVAKDSFIEVGDWDEENKFLSVVGQSYGAALIGPNKTCGWDSTGFRAALEEVIIPLIQEGHWVEQFNQDPSIWQAWLDESPPFTIIGQPNFCCAWGVPSQPVGISFTTPSAIPKNLLWHPTENPTGTIGEAYIPGRTGFLGGSGITIARSSRNPDLAFSLIDYLINPAVNIIDQGHISLPPYASFQTKPEWQDPRWDVLRYIQSHSATPTYPVHTPYQMGDVENRKPLRLMLMDIRFKNKTAQEAIDRACIIFDDIFKPACSEIFWTYNVSECDPATLQRTVTYFWNPNMSCTSYLGTPLPTQDYVRCSYVPYANAAPITLMTLASLVAVVGFILIGLLLTHWSAQAVRSSSPLFGLILLCGCLITFVTVYVMAGPASRPRCVIRVWFLSIGFVLGISAFLVKTLRFERIVYHKQQEGPMKFFLEDFNLVMIVIALVALDIGLLFIWTFVPPIPTSLPYTTVLTGGAVVVQDACTDGHLALVIILFVYPGILVLMLCFLAYRTRGAPSEFNEHTFITTVVGILIVVAAVVIPIVYLLTVGPIIPYIFVSAGIIVAAGSAMLVYTVPKILAAHGIEILEAAEEMNAVHNAVAAARSRNSMTGPGTGTGSSKKNTTQKTVD